MKRGVMVPQIEIEFYKTENGECPTEKFLDSLSGKNASCDFLSSREWI